jgi:pyruvate/2-oxoglutarate dehydrogenase complex dihydrolipoamide dehydrogenase (E3) component
MIKVITRYKVKILGCGIVGWQAGELIPPWVLILTKVTEIGYISK